MGADAVIKAVDAAMTWVITFLRRRDVQKYLRELQVDEVFKWLSTEIKTVRAKVNIKALLNAFDKGIRVMERLANKVSLVPTVGKRTKAALEQVKNVRLIADKHLADAIKPVSDILDTIVLRLEREMLEKQYGIVNANNVHFRGALPDTIAVKLMRKANPMPDWLSRGAKEEWIKAEYNRYKTVVDAKVKDGWPSLSKQNVESFHTLSAAEITGPARLYRILAPNSRGMSDCWVTEEIFKKIQTSSDPRSAWRKYLAVWPDWNVNGQFVIYDVKAKETLKVWRGPASSQVRADLPNRHLEGGWEQIVFSIDRKDIRNDTMHYYKTRDNKPLKDWISQDEFNKLNSEKKKAYTAIREQINHRSISGPFETGWGYTDFEGKGFLEKVGLPNLPGQTTTVK